MHAVHPFFLSPEIVLHQAFDHEIMATRGLCGLLQSAPKRMTALVSILQVAASNPGLVCLLRTFWYRYVERALLTMCASACRMRTGPHTNSADSGVLLLTE